MQFEGEVLFLTSSDRIYKAFLDEYQKTDPKNQENKILAAEWTRRFIRRLQVPTAREANGE